MKLSNSVTRRGLMTALPAGCIGCLGARMCAAQDAATPALRSGEKADMTWQQVFDFAFGHGIPMLTKMAEQVGRTQLVDMIRKASDAATIENVAKAPLPPEKRDLAAWVAPMKRKSALYEHALVMDVVKDTPTEFAIKVSQCLWAKTFRGKSAADFGYAMICHPDFAAVTAFNPKLKMIRTKTLMQGDDCCDHRYVVA